MTLSATPVTKQQRTMGIVRPVAIALCAFAMGILASTLFGRFAESTLVSASVEGPLQLPDVKSRGLEMDDFDFGVIESGGRRNAIVWIRNTSSEPIQVLRAKTSCDCVVARVSAGAIPGNSKAPFFLSYDDSDEPGFIGQLGVKILVVTDQESDIALGTVTIEISSDITARHLALMHF